MQPWGRLVRNCAPGQRRVHDRQPSHADREFRLPLAGPLRAAVQLAQSRRKHTWEIVVLAVGVPGPLRGD